MQRNRQRKRNRNASDIEVDRELAAQPEPSQAQKSKKASGEALRDRHDKNTWHAKKAKRHTVMRGVCAAGLEAGAVVASEVVEARLCVVHTMSTHATKFADLHRCLAVVRISIKPTTAQGSSKQSAARESALENSEQEVSKVVLYLTLS
ncbi:hypothetical protein QJQ45_014713, partial [Haematococcus lacustris]